MLKFQREGQFSDIDTCDAHCKVRKQVGMHLIQRAVFQCPGYFEEMRMAPRPGEL